VLIRRPIRDWAADIAFTTAAALIDGVFVLAILDDRIGDLPAVSARIGRHVYRIVQEGLTNARKHAPGAHVRVTVDGTPANELTVEVHNGLSPAVTATPRPGAGAGLIGLRERVALVGGRLEHGRTSDGGFRLQAWLPWPR
jgi:signal transduction histidine kinase